MAETIQSKYVSFWTREFWEKTNDEAYNLIKFEKIYRASPGRMTPEQVKAHGYDIARSRMYSKYLEEKYHSLRVNEVAMANSVAEQIEKAIKQMYPNLPVQVKMGEVHKYGHDKLRFPKIYVGNVSGYSGLCITPNLNDKDDNYLSIEIRIKDDENDYKNSLYGNDIQMMTEIGKYVDYVKTKKMPHFGIDKVYNRCENQYILSLGTYKIELYDVEMVNLYHTLSKAMNAEYGTNFPYSEKVIKKLYKHPVHGNIQYVGTFYLKSIYSNRATLMNSYFYKDDKTHLPTFGSTSTYGEWTKEDLIHLLDVLQPYVKNNYFGQMSQQVLEKKYGKYDDIGVRYSQRPRYFDVLVWEED